MKTKFNSLVALSLVILVAGCRKHDLQKENPGQNTMLTENTRAWLQVQPGALSMNQPFLLDGKRIDVGQSILWNETHFHAKEKVSITPVHMLSIPDPVSVDKYLVTEYDDGGAIINANYFLVRSGSLTNQNKEQAVTPGLFLSTNDSKDFKGAVIKYDLKGNMLSSRHYSSGGLSGETDKLALKRSKNQIPVENTAPLEEGCSYVTIDWYWQTWVNGVLVSEEYLFTSTEIVCQGGGGGGGVTPPTDLVMCEAAVANILNATLPASNQLSNIIESESPLTRTRLYSWKCVKNVGWWVVAYDRGVQKRIATNKPWTWQSLENLSISKQGTTVAYGGEVVATKVTSQSVIGISNSVMYLVVNIRAKVSRNGVSVTDERDISSHFTYHVDTAPIPGF